MSKEMTNEELLKLLDERGLADNVASSKKRFPGRISESGKTVWVPEKGSMFISRLTKADFKALSDANVDAALMKTIAQKRGVF